MRHLANTYHLSKEAYLRKTPKNGKSRAHILVEKCPPVGPRGPLKSRLSALAYSDGLRPMGTYLPVPRFPGGDLGGGGGCLAGGFLAASLAICLAGFFASAAALVGAAFAAAWFAWAG